MTPRHARALRFAYALVLVAAALAVVSMVFPAGWFLAGAFSFEAGPYDSERSQDLAMFRDELRRISRGILALHVVTACALLGAAGIGLSGRGVGPRLALGALGLFVSVCLLDGGVALWSSSTVPPVLGVAPTVGWLVLRLGVAIAASARFLRRI